MTLEQVLAGPVADRQNGSRHPLTEAEARGILHDVERQMSRKRRGQYIRKMADVAARGIGCVSPEAIALYRAYAAAYGN